MKFKKVEITFFAALAVTFICTFALARQQENISNKLIRLHVVAHSDGEDDQALKLRVRDAVLDALAAPMSGVASRSDGLRVIGDNLAAAEDVALREIAASGYEYGVAALLTRENFPTRAYDTFTLPAGAYETLRVVIGDGAGQNWWCVIYPPLCRDAVTEDLGGDDADGLTEDEVRLISGGDTGAVAVRFRVLEVVAKVRQWLGK